jgi:DNA-binding CsgD family transcriptional regulator
VGREAEVADLTRALDDAVQGHGRLVTLVGEPGIGKTRTARQLEAAAVARGARVLWGRCYEEGGAPPFWIWVQSIRAYVQAADPAELYADLGPGAPDVAEVVTDVRRVLPDLEVSPPLGPDQARFRFYDSVTAFLQRASRRQPLIFILDNLHWADRPSLLLLEFLASELAQSRLLIIGTYRDSELSRRHPLARTLSQLAKEQRYHRILLRGLDQEDVRAFLAARIAVAPPESLAEAVYRQTEGNPLFVSELIRLLEQEGVLAADRLRSGSVVLPDRIPEGVREVIGRRLDRLPADSNRVLKVASAIGREFAVDLLQGLLGDLPVERVAETVEAAVGPGLVEAVAGVHDRYRFTHVLVQQTLNDELSVGERVTLHGQIAEALETLYGGEVEQHAVELAHHLSQAASASDSPRLVRYCRLAGEQALGLHAYDDAVAYFERALAGKKSGPVDEETAAILFGLGRAQAAALPRQRMREAVATLTRACDYYVATNNAERAIEVAVLPFYPVWGQPGGQTQLLARALRLVPEGSKEEARLLGRYARLLALEEYDIDAARPALERALTIARASDDPALELRVLADAANADLFDVATADCLAKVSRALEIVAAIDDPQAELDARYSAVQMSFVVGDLRGVERFGFAMLPLAERLRDRFWLASAHRARVYVHWMRGELQAARAESDLSLAAATDEPRDLTIRAQLEYEAGRFSEGERYLDRLLGLAEATPPVPNLEHMFTALVVPLVGRIEGSTSRLPLAERAAIEVLSGKPDSVGVPPRGRAVWEHAHIGQAVMAIMQDDPAGARAQYAALVGGLQQQGLNFTTICGDRLLGLLAWTFGDARLARQHFAAALPFCEERGLRLELAWTCYDWANLLADSTRADDRGRCVDLLNRALSICQELGLRPLHRRATELAERLTPYTSPRAALPDDLTEREVEVLRLMAAGKTDRAIADALVISPRTVNNHVSSILSKTGSANRTEAATYALRHGML